MELVGAEAMTTALRKRFVAGILRSLSEIKSLLFSMCDKGSTDIQMAELLLYI